MIFARVRDIATIFHGGTPRKQKPEYWAGEIPWVSPKDVKGDSLYDTADHISKKGLENSATRLVPAGTIIAVVRSGVLAHSFPLALIGRPMAFNQDIKAVVPNREAVLPEYLFYCLRARENDVVSRGVKKGATVHSLQSGYLEDLRVPLRPLSDQVTIVDILKRADGIRRLRKQAQDTARQLIPALFLDMFGDPATNPNGWQIRKVSDFVSRFEGGKNLQAGSPQQEGLRILKVSAVTSGRYLEQESKPAPNGYSPPVSHFIKPDDLLFSRANTEQLVGATALVCRTNGRTLLPDKIWRFVWAEAIEPLYVHALLQNTSVRRVLSKLATGTSSSMRNISQAKLKNLELPIAPLKEQREFVLTTRCVESVMRQQGEACQKAEDAFLSLLNRAFTN